MRIRVIDLYGFKYEMIAFFNIKFNHAKTQKVMKKYFDGNTYFQNRFSSFRFHCS